MNEYKSFVASNLDIFIYSFFGLTIKSKNVHYQSLPLLLILYKWNCNCMQWWNTWCLHV